MVGHWSWTVGTVTVTPYDGSPDTTTGTGTFTIALMRIKDPGKPDDGTIDDTNSRATGTGTFLLSGYYAIPVTATVHYVDKVSGADGGTFSGTDYVGDPDENPAYDPSQAASGSSGSATSPNIAGEQPNAPAGTPPGTPAPPAPTPLPNRVASGIFAKLPSPIKLGLYSKDHATETYTLVVQPKIDAGDITLDIPTKVAEADLTAETKKDAKGQDVPTGNLKLVLKALKPSGDQSGDTMVATRKSTKSGSWKRTSASA